MSSISRVSESSSKPSDGSKSSLGSKSGLSSGSRSSSSKPANFSSAPWLLTLFKDDPEKTVLEKALVQNSDLVPAAVGSAIMRLVWQVEKHLVDRVRSFGKVDNADKADRKSAAAQPLPAAGNRAPGVVLRGGRGSGKKTTVMELARRFGNPDVGGFPSELKGFAVVQLGLDLLLKDPTDPEKFAAGLRSLKTKKVFVFDKMQLKYLREPELKPVLEVLREAPNFCCVFMTHETEYVDSDVFPLEWLDVRQTFEQKDLVKLLSIYHNQQAALAPVPIAIDDQALSAIASISHYWETSAYLPQSQPLAAMMILDAVVAGAPDAAADAARERKQVLDAKLTITSALVLAVLKSRFKSAIESGPQSVFQLVSSGQRQEALRVLQSNYQWCATPEARAQFDTYLSMLRDLVAKDESSQLVAILDGFVTSAAPVRTALARFVANLRMSLPAGGGAGEAAMARGGRNLWIEGGPGSGKRHLTNLVNVVYQHLRLVDKDRPISVVQDLKDWSGQDAIERKVRQARGGVLMFRGAGLPSVQNCSADDSKLILLALSNQLSRQAQVPSAQCVHLVFAGTANELAALRATPQLDVNPLQFDARVPEYCRFVLPASYSAEELATIILATKELRSSHAGVDSTKKIDFEESMLKEKKLLTGLLESELLVPALKPYITGHVNAHVTAQVLQAAWDAAAGHSLVKIREQDLKDAVRNVRTALTETMKAAEAKAAAGPA